MDDFKFDKILCEYFGAENGAGSRITPKDEGQKGQITITQKFERPIFEEYFGDFLTGKKEDLGDACLNEFKIFPSGETVRLPILLRPGERRNELRLYMKAGLFRPASDMFWFAYLKEGYLWLGSLSEAELNQIRIGAYLDLQDGILEIPEDNYQNLVNDSKKPKQITREVTAYQRDPNIAKEVLENSDYICEIFPEHPSFISKKSGKPYLEAHHFVPMFEQRRFPDYNLDVKENICILNPYSHRLVHHANYADIEAHIKKLAEPREEFLKGLGLSVDRVLKIYEGV
ncbi:hypothetical protein A9Q96_04895 [Rhodobacterales bacterium 52_120_T64]|nr:hypothetical protein A9Q96_04895 [Rhodobacterales bacterium 52_120_T64]